MCHHARIADRGCHWGWQRRSRIRATHASTPQLTIGALGKAGRRADMMALTSDVAQLERLSSSPCGLLLHRVTGQPMRLRFEHERDRDLFCSIVNVLTPEIRVEDDCEKRCVCPTLPQRTASRPAFMRTSESETVVAYAVIVVSSGGMHKQRVLALDTKMGLLQQRRPDGTAIGQVRALQASLCPQLVPHRVAVNRGLPVFQAFQVSSSVRLEPSASDNRRVRLVPLPPHKSIDCLFPSVAVKERFAVTAPPPRWYAASV